MLSLRRAALIAAIALGLVRAHRIIDQFLGWMAAPIPWWRSTISFGACVLPLLPLPVMLVLLYRSGAALTVPEHWRRVVLVLAILYGTIFVAPTLYLTKTTLAADAYEIQWTSGSTVAEKLAVWRRSDKAIQQLWAMIALCFVVAFLVLLVALYRSRVPEAESVPTYWLREMAALTTIVGGLALLALIGWRIYVLARFGQGWEYDNFSDRPTLIWRVWSTLNSVLPEACEMLAAYIVYRSIPPPSAAVPE